jgi:two-component system, OmpR family, sensor histidine kinase TctE
LPGSSGVGSGLGLAIVREIAEFHQATVAMGQASDAGGLTMRVTFPMLNSAA